MRETLTGNGNFSRLLFRHKPELLTRFKREILIWLATSECLRLLHFNFRKLINTKFDIKYVVLRFYVNCNKSKSGIKCKIATENAYLWLVQITRKRRFNLNGLSIIGTGRTVKLMSIRGRLRKCLQFTTFFGLKLKLINLD